MSHNDPLYTVTQLGAELGVTVRTLHFYEAQGLLTPRRAGNTRVYSQRDRARMILILRGKRLGFSIKEIKEYIELYDIDPTHGQQTKALLKAVQKRMHKLEEQRHAVEETLTELRRIELQCEESLQAMGNLPDLAPNIEPKTGQAKKAAAKPIGRSL
jgi:DNA-binding transcriptional MerR regulator